MDSPTQTVFTKH